MNKQTSLLTGSALFLTSALVNYAARFLVSVIIARSLGLDGKGTYALIVTTGSLFALLSNPGLNTAITYLTAGQKADSQKLMGFIIQSHVSISLIGGIFMIGAYYFFLRTTLLNGISWLQITSILVYFPVYLLTILLNAHLLGKQQILQVTLTDILRGLANLVLQGFSWLLNMGINGAISAWLLANLIALGLTLFHSRNSLPAIYGGFRNIAKPALQYGSKSYLANLLNFFNYRLDTFLVNMFSGLSQVGIYTTGVAVAELVFFIPNAISSALFPKIPKLDAHTASQLTARLCRYIIVTVTMAALFLAWTGERLIVWLYSETFRPSFIALIFLLPGMIGVSINKILSAHLSGSGKPEYAARTAFITVIITVVGDILFIPKYGIVGAAAVSSFAYLIGAILTSFWFLREERMHWHELYLPRPSDAVFLANSIQTFMKKTFFSKLS